MSLKSSAKKQKMDEKEVALTSPDYTVFNHFEKYCIVISTSTITIWSPIGQPVYYPALLVLENHFHISEELVNLSIVLYMICQSITPLVLSAFADKLGRRPILLVILAGFCAASAGIAVCNSYSAILVLRSIQSSFIGPSVPIIAGQVGDFTERSNRGSFILLSNSISSMGQAFVGNGSVQQSSIFNCTLFLYIPYFRKKWHFNSPDIQTLEPKDEFDLLSSFRILIRPELTICLLNGAIHYSIWVVSLTCLTNVLIKEYDYSVMKVGLCYLPAGIGGMIGSLFAGRALNYTYKIQRASFEKRKSLGLIPENKKFNIVRARVTVAVPYALVADTFSMMYGWCLYKKVHISAILVSEYVCLGSLALTGINSSLMVDLYPSNA
ncbi:hypothetical protein WICMUC_001390 [Wickerhamomyces mucosus]|uniref:Major facilitator superfamily (MFS) profile domain-containing protein n=1 Tax=Wickerhamomyces mucosus TaxID=1378264 RepID=A0A9P8PTZ5_9ASCO|nr:hypothetical protein WICMUC_001390 [Wickerhamomyces mucosus]